MNYPAKASNTEDTAVLYLGGQVLPNVDERAQNIAPARTATFYYVSKVVVY